MLPTHRGGRSGGGFVRRIMLSLWAVVPRIRALLSMPRISMSMVGGADAKQPRFRSWPITETSNLEPSLRSMGLRVRAREIDGTAPGSTGTCLSDALVSVGPAGRGGTGSFIGAKGLIITNHHVALDAVRQASTTEHDYLKEGFVAKDLSEEVMGPDYEVGVRLHARPLLPLLTPSTPNPHRLRLIRTPQPDPFLFLPPSASAHCVDVLFLNQ